MAEQNKNNFENNQTKINQLAADIVSLIHNNSELATIIGPSESIVVKDQQSAKYYELSYFNTDNNTVVIDLVYGLEDKTHEDTSLPLVTLWKARIMSGVAMLDTIVDGQRIERELTISELDELSHSFIDPHVLSEDELIRLEKLLAADKSLEHEYKEENMKSVETLADAHAYKAANTNNTFTEEDSRRISKENESESKVKKVVRKAMGSLARSLGEPYQNPDSPKRFPRKFE